MAGEVTAAAKEVETWLKEEGPLHKQEIRSRLLEMGVAVNTWGTVLASGAKSGQNKWWIDENDLVHAGPRPKAEATLAQINESEAASFPPNFGVTNGNGLHEPMSMDGPQEQFERICLNLGVPARNSTIAAFFCFSNFNMMDPRLAWTAILKTNTIPPSMKQNVWQTWMSNVNITPPPELEQAARYLRPAPEDTPAGTVRAGPGGGAPRRFLARQGEVVDMHFDDPTHMTMAEASFIADSQLAKLKAELAGKPVAGEGTLMGAVVQDYGETLRQVLGGGEGESTTDKLVLPLLMKLLDTSLNGNNNDNNLEMFRLNMQHSDDQMKLLQMQIEHSNEKFMEGLKMLASRDNASNPLDSLERVLPGAKHFIETNLWGQQRNQPTLMTTNGEMTVDTWERIQEINRRNEQWAWLREQAPTVVNSLKEFGAAARRQADIAAGTYQPPQASVDLDALAAQDQAEAPPVPEGHHLVGCAQCKQLVMVPNGIVALGCPYCQTYQKPDGTIITQEEATALVTEAASPASSAGSGQAQSSSQPTPPEPVDPDEIGTSDVNNSGSAQEAAVGPEAGNPPDSPGGIERMTLSPFPIHGLGSERIELVPVASQPFDYAQESLESGTEEL